MLTLGFGYWGEWALEEKITFDGVNKLMVVYDHVTVLDIQEDVWSAWVRWRGMGNRGYDRFADAMDFSGYDQIPDGRGGTTRTGLIYFLTNGWRLVVDLSKVAIFGVLFSRDFETAYYTTELVGQKPATVSSLVNSAVVTTNVVTGDLSTVVGDIATLSTDVANLTADVGDVSTDVAEVFDHVKNQPQVVYVDTESLINGDGGARSPFNNLADCLDFAELNGLRVIGVYADITLDRNLKNFTLRAIGLPAIDLNNQNVDKSDFERFTLKGNSTGTITAFECVLWPGLQVDGIYNKCAFLGVVEQVAGTLYAECYSGVTGSEYVGISVSAGNAVVRAFVGSCSLSDVTQGTHSFGCLTDGRLIAENTCVGGLIHFRGSPFEIVDNSSVGCTTYDETTSRHIADVTINELEF